MSKISYLYHLVDPRNDEVRYVGRSVNPQSRYSHHINTYSNGEKKRWINELKKENLLPKLVIVRACRENQAKRLESEMICNMLNEGARLTNAIYKGYKWRTMIENS